MIRIRHVLALGITALLACEQSKVVSAYKATDPNSSSGKQSDSNSSSQSFQFRDTRLTTASITDVKVASGAKIPSDKFPQLSLDQGSADYVMLLRCASTYKLTSAMGTDARTLTNDSANLMEKQYAWTQAWGNTDSCDIVSTNYVGTSFTDYAANDGDFYYVLNPCITSASGGTAKPTCSYRLAFSDPVTGFKNTLRAEAKAASIQLALLQSEMTAQLQDVGQLSIMLAWSLRNCENEVIFKTVENEVLAGFINLGVFGVVTILGTLVSPGNGYMAGLTAEMISEQVLVPYLKLGPVANTCMSGKLTKQMKQGHGSYWDKWQSKDANTFQREYGVHALMMQIQGIFAKNGPVNQLTKKIAAQYKILQQYASDAVSLDQQMMSHGVRPQDPNSYANAIPGNNQENLQKEMEQLLKGGI